VTALPTPATRLVFTPLSDYGDSSWSRPADLFWLDRLGILPVADAEILALAHFCPIAIDVAGGTPRVVTVVHSRHVAHQLVSDEGRWKPPYAPLAIRTMPFRNAPVARDGIEICLEIAEAGGDPRLRQPMFGQKGGATQPWGSIQTMLGHLRKGAPRLANAAKALLGLDLLTPIADLADGHPASLATIRTEDLLAIQPGRIVALTADSCCPLELATAMAFSRRWLAPEALKGDTRQHSPVLSSVREKLYGHALVEPLDEAFALDHSPLFSFDDFSARAKGMG
jgi:hypothetical protein